MSAVDRPAVLRAWLAARTSDARLKTPAAIAARQDRLWRRMQPVIARTPAELPDPVTLMNNPDGMQSILANFIAWCRGHGVAVVGGLPTVFDDKPVPDPAIAELRDFYGRNGAGFLLLPNRSQYPRDDFYDSAYHLRQSAQEKHSAALAEGLRPFLPRSP